MGLIHAKEVHCTRTTQEETRLMNGKELHMVNAEYKRWVEMLTH